MAPASGLNCGRAGQVVTEAEAIQRMLQENLGIAVAQDQERSFYMDKLPRL